MITDLNHTRFADPLPLCPPTPGPGARRVARPGAERPRHLLYLLRLCCLLSVRICLESREREKMRETLCRCVEHTRFVGYCGFHFSINYFRQKNAINVCYRQGSTGTALYMSYVEQRTPVRTLERERWNTQTPFTVNVPDTSTDDIPVILEILSRVDMCHTLNRMPPESLPLSLSPTRGWGLGD